MENNAISPSQPMSFSNRLIWYCKTNGLNISSKRIAVANALEETGQGIAADELLLLMRKSQIKISFPYVYQCLNWLLEIGFVVKQTGTDKRQRFAVNREAVI